MSEWIVPISDDLARELEECLSIGPIINDDGARYLTEEVFDRLNGLKIELFSNEHPPPHFRVCFQGDCNNFTIKDCTPMNGNGLSRYFRNINRWHKKTRKDLLTSGIVRDPQIAQSGTMWRNKVEFNAGNYPTIEAACESKKEIEFYIDINATAFSESEAPDEWTASPPAYLSKEEYTQVFILSGNDIRGKLIKLELEVHLHGGRILYKKRGEAQVSIKVTWPNAT